MNDDMLDSPLALALDSNDDLLDTFSPSLFDNETIADCGYDHFQSDIIPTPEKGPDDVPDPDHQFVADHNMDWNLPLDSLDPATLHLNNNVPDLVAATDEENSCCTGGTILDKMSRKRYDENYKIMSRKEKTTDPLLLKQKKKNIGPSPTTPGLLQYKVVSNGVAEWKDHPHSTMITKDYILEKMKQFKFTDHKEFIKALRANISIYLEGSIAVVDATWTCPQGVALKKAWKADAKAAKTSGTAQPSVPDESASQTRPIETLPSAPTEAHPPAPAAAAPPFASADAPLTAQQVLDLMQSHRKLADDRALEERKFNAQLALDKQKHDAELVAEERKLQAQLTHNKEMVYVKTIEKQATSIELLSSGTPARRPQRKVVTEAPKPKKRAPIRPKTSRKPHAPPPQLISSDDASSSEQSDTNELPMKTPAPRMANPQSTPATLRRSARINKKLNFA